MNKIFMIISTIFVVGLSALFGVGSASASDFELNKLENSWGTIKKTSMTNPDDIRTMAVLVRGLDEPEYLTEGTHFVVKRNGDIVKPDRKYSSDYLYNTANWSESDQISIALVGSVGPLEVQDAFFAVSNSSVTGFTGGFQGRAIWDLRGLSDDQKESFFKEPILGEVEIQEIPLVMLKNLVAGGILSQALIIFAILLGVGLVARYLHSLRSLR